MLTSPRMWKPRRQGWWDWRHTLWVWHWHGLHHVTSKSMSSALTSLQSTGLRFPTPYWTIWSCLELNLSKMEVFITWAVSQQTPLTSGTVNTRGMVPAYSSSSLPIGFLPGLLPSPTWKAVLLSHPLLLLFCQSADCISQVYFPTYIPLCVPSHTALVFI